MSEDLLATARRLAKASPKKPRQADLKRAISTAYYAVFHAVARNNADLLIGTSADRPDKAWTQTYRALEHGSAKSACGQLRNLGFPPALCLVGDVFVTLQEARHKADYDPRHRVTRADALTAANEAAAALSALKAADRKDRKALAILLLLKKR
ncbi:hypothetical protein KHC23_08750 [Ancylobacter dichloromethanicus]|uniref:HEPN domain-containing protein n=1 Tax=Ancylobacter dichloromethanicus TaxID=518825 RepID=A0A9W6MYE0_9HYPH|nr:hypothetical protein [Ancylobacter dichloromethanicus]MBS7553738.1 hypothetical protein [Ancylobacter dichloromethanicus]GLK70842.1 hypothetical protein GCM10017643_09570 [Ancylobacter dichloromethanicus]